MTEVELEEAIDRVILESGLPPSQVTGVLELMMERYHEEAASLAVGDQDPDD